MITVAKAKKIIGKNKEGLSDEQVELLISQCYALAEVMFEQFKLTQTIKEVKSKNDKS